MSVDLEPLIDPASTAVVVFECQAGILGPGSPLPGLKGAAEAGAMLERLGKLLAAAREAGVRVFYVTVAKRRDGVGNAFNTPIERRIRTSDGKVFDAGPICDEVAPSPGDVVLKREHGVTGFFESGLDTYLRNTGIRQIVLGGVSVNIGILGTAIEAVNHGYTVVVPPDCVAGDPPEYAEQALRYAVRNVAFLFSSDEIGACWTGRPS